MPTVRDTPQEMSPQVLAEWLKSPTEFILLDVREPYEWNLAHLDTPATLRMPLSELSAQGSRALPPALRDQTLPVVVVCHSGERSRLVANWLAANQWSQVYNLTGGLHAYAHQVDPSIGWY